MVCPASGGSLEAAVSKVGGRNFAIKSSDVNVD
jgi:hypothetical protein